MTFAGDGYVVLVPGVWVVQVVVLMDRVLGLCWSCRSPVLLAYVKHAYVRG
jgi:hypothetical protein